MNDDLISAVGAEIIETHSNLEARCYENDILLPVPSSNESQNENRQSDESEEEEEEVSKREPGKLYLCHCGPERVVEDKSRTTATMERVPVNWEGYKMRVHEDRVYVLIKGVYNRQTQKFAEEAFAYFFEEQDHKKIRFEISILC